MQQIYRRTPMPKCYFSKFAKYGCSHVNLLNICRTLFPQNTSGGMHMSVELIKVFKNQLPNYFRKNHDFLLCITLSKKLRMLYLSLSQLAVSFLSELLKYPIIANFDVGFDIPFNLFHATGLFLYPQKISRNLRFSDVFRGYRNRLITENGLRRYTKYAVSHACCIFF